METWGSLDLEELWRRQWQPTLVLLPGKSQGRKSLVGCSPWGREESDTTEWLHFPFSLSCIGKGNGNPLQCSCLENPRDGGAWWAAVYRVAQSRTRLKWLSSSTISPSIFFHCSCCYYFVLLPAPPVTPPLFYVQDRLYFNKNFHKSTLIKIYSSLSWTKNILCHEIVDLTDAGGIAMFLSCKYRHCGHL